MILINKDNEMNFGRNKVEKENNGLNGSASVITDSQINDNNDNSNDESNSNINQIDSNFNDNDNGNDNIEVGLSHIVGGDAKILTTRDSFVFQIDHTATSDYTIHRQKDNSLTDGSEGKGKDESIGMYKKTNLSISLSASNLGEDDRMYEENDWNDDDFASLSVSVRTVDIPLKGEVYGSEEDGDDNEEEDEEDEESGEEEDDEEAENANKIHK